MSLSQGLLFSCLDCLLEIVVFLQFGLGSSRLTSGLLSVDNGLVSWTVCCRMWVRSLFLHIFWLIIIHLYIQSLTQNSLQNHTFILSLPWNCSCQGCQWLILLKPVVNVHPIFHLIYQQHLKINPFLFLRTVSSHGFQNITVWFSFYPTVYFVHLCIPNFLNNLGL